MKAWETDPATQKQLEFLKKLGCDVMPTTKGEAARLIDNKLRKPKAPTLRVVYFDDKSDDVNSRVDQAAQKAKEQLDANTKALHRKRPAAVVSATPSFTVFGVERPDAEDEQASGRDDPALSELDRSAAPSGRNPQTVQDHSH